MEERKYNGLGASGGPILGGGLYKRTMILECPSHGEYKIDLAPSSQTCPICFKQASLYRQNEADRASNTQPNTDAIAEKLDEMADISEYWRKNREKGRSPSAIRAAMVMLAGEIVLLKEIQAAKTYQATEISPSPHSQSTHGVP